MRMVVAWAALIVSATLALAEPLTIAITDASAAIDKRTGEAVLKLTLDSAASQAFADFTSANVGRTIELRADGDVLLSAVLRDPILSGSVEVTGHSKAEYDALARRISAGAARVEVEAK